MRDRFEADDIVGMLSVGCLFFVASGFGSVLYALAYSIITESNCP